MEALREAFRRQQVRGKVPPLTEEQEDTLIEDWCSSNNFVVSSDVDWHTARSLALSDYNATWRSAQAERVIVSAADEEALVAEWQRQRRIEQARVHYWERITAPVVRPMLTYEEIHERILPGLRLTDYNPAIIRAMALYAAKDPRFETLHDEGLRGMKLDKGIMLLGPVGCGKTHLMKLLAPLAHRGYGVADCADVARRYKEEGEEALVMYTRASRGGYGRVGDSEPAGWCFDDLGAERDKKHYGDGLNVMADILTRLYNNPELRGWIHLTTNLDGDDIEDRYGARLRSRLREMVNFICFDPASPDMRA